MKKLSDLVTRLDLNEAVKKLDEKNRAYKDQILTGLDGVVKELETMREENTVGAHQTREVRVEVDDHEKRISKLESTA